MIRRLWWQDLAWAGFILVLATALGLLEQWPLVKISFKGELRPRLENLRARQREVKFQGVKTLSLSQAYESFEKGQTVFIDARKADEFAELHIPRAINLTPELLEKKGVKTLAGIPQDRPLVVYCGQANCDSALKVAEKLQSLGFTQVTAFLAGFRAWDEAGYPADTSK